MRDDFTAKISVGFRRRTPPVVNSGGASSSVFKQLELLEQLERLEQAPLS
jgi:hypothetical protein